MWILFLLVFILGMLVSLVGQSFVTVPASPQVESTPLPLPRFSLWSLLWLLFTGSLLPPRPLAEEGHQ